MQMTMREWVAYQGSLGDRYVPTALAGVLSGVMRCLVLLQERTRRAGAVNTGRYLAAWKVSKLPNGARVFNQAPYAGVIEQGRRPGKFPPVTAIERWVTRKLGLKGAEARTAAFLIGRAIQRRGIRARRILTDPANLEAMTALVQEEVSRVLREMLATGSAQVLALGGEP